MDKLNEALIQFQKSQEALLETLKKVVDAATTSAEIRGKLVESKQGMDEFFGKLDEFYYKRYGNYLSKK